MVDRWAFSTAPEQKDWDAAFNRFSGFKMALYLGRWAIAQYDNDPFELYHWCDLAEGEWCDLAEGAEGRIIIFAHYHGEPPYHCDHCKTEIPKDVVLKFQLMR